MEMLTEEKDFHWVCSLLATAKVGIGIIETLFIQKDDSLLWVYTGKSGKVKKRPSPALSDHSPLSLISQFQSYHSGSSTCILLLKPWSRSLFDLAKTEDTSIRQSSFARCIAIQSYCDYQTVFTVRLDHSVGAIDSIYKSAFLVRKGSVVEEGRSHRIWHKALSAVKVILRVAEKAKGRIVTNVEAEFVLSPTGDVYLYGIPTVKLLKGGGIHREPALIAPSFPQNRSDVVENHRKKVRIATPSGLRSQCEPQIAGFPTSEHSLSPGLKGWKSGGRGSDPFNNPNFREMIALNYAKSRPGVRRGDIDAVFEDMDMEEEGKGGFGQLKEPVLTVIPAISDGYMKNFTAKPMKRREISIPHSPSAPVISPKASLTPGMKSICGSAILKRRRFSHKILSPLLMKRRLERHRRGGSLKGITYYFKTVDQ